MACFFPGEVGDFKGVDHWMLIWWNLLLNMYHLLGKLESKCVWNLNYPHSIMKVVNNAWLTNSATMLFPFHYPILNPELYIANSSKPNKPYLSFWYHAPPQVKCRLLISNIFYVMNFRHFSEMPLIIFQHCQKMSEIHCIKNVRN